LEALGKLFWQGGPPMFHRLIVCLVAGVVVLPIVLSVLVALARLLGAMGDAGGAVVLDRIGLGVGIVWLVDFVSLVLVLALERIGPPGRDS
jgi:hypothetical protein